MKWFLNMILIINVIGYIVDILNWYYNNKGNDLFLLRCVKD